MTEAVLSENQITRVKVRGGSRAGRKTAEDSSLINDNLV